MSDISVSRVGRGRHFLQRAGRSVVPVGSHFVPRSGPDWPWRTGAGDFDAAFAAMSSAGLNAVRIDMFWAAMEPARGEWDEAHLTVLDEIVAAAARHGLWIHPTFFIGGEVGDAYWDLPWASGRNPHTDPELLAAQAEHVAAIGRRWAGRDEILAWDLTDEPPFWVFPDLADEQAEAWTRTLCDALRAADPDHLITIGTASQEVGWGPFRADVVAGHLDFACVHPYPIFSPTNYPEALIGRRTTHAHAFETALARGAGRPVMVHEYGASSAQFAPERIAIHDRLGSWAAFGRGAIGFFSWCWNDAEPEAYRRAPYVRTAHETQFGTLTHDGRPRPRAAELTALAEVLGAIDLDRFAGHGPVARAATLVPHEYVHPYDREAFGLDDAPSGPYLPAEKAWRPDRDVQPLVQGWLTSFVLAAQGGMALDFVRERIDAELPDPRTTPLLLCPAPLTTCENSLVGLRTSHWQAAREYVMAGGTLYLSCSVATAVPELSELAGVRILDRAPSEAVELRFVTGVGPVEAGATVRLPRAIESIRRGVLLEVDDAEVIGRDQRDRPVLTLARRGAGQVIVCAHPLELLLAEQPDDPFADSDCWRIYAVLAALSDAALPARFGHHDATSGMLRGESGGLLVVSNHTPQPISGPVLLPSDACDARVVFPRDVPFHPTAMTVPAHGVRVITWSDGRAPGSETGS